MRALKKGQPFLAVKAEGSEHPVFSEMFPYDRIGKEDARFVLAVAEEYDHLICVLSAAEAERLLSLPRKGNNL